MKKIDNNLKNIKGSGGMFGFGGWGIATMANALINGTVGVVTNSLNIANSLKQNNNYYVYKPCLSTKFNFFN